MYIYNDSSAYGKNTTAPKRSFALLRAPLDPPWAVSGGLGGARVGLGGAQGGAQGEMIRPWDAPGGSRRTACRPRAGLGEPSNAQMSVLER